MSLCFATLLKQIRPKHESKQVLCSDAAEDELDVLIRRAEDAYTRAEGYVTYHLCINFYAVNAGSVKIQSGHPSVLYS
jgi:hypothetical protein